VSAEDVDSPAVDPDVVDPNAVDLVGDGDMGRVIGKRGRIAQAIRTVVRAAAVKDGIAVDIEFVD